MKKIRIGDTVYYDDPVNDEFSGIERQKITVGPDFEFYRGGILYRAVKFVVYRMFVTPFAFLYTWLKFGMKTVGREKLGKQKKAYFLFGNHTQVPGDGFITNVLTFPRETHILVNSDNIALKGTKALMMMLGALPIPTVPSGFSKFFAAIEKHITKRHCIAVFPEAHIWPYASIIRPFPDTSFRFPVKYSLPSYCFTVTYKKSRRGKPRITAYVDGPFYGDGETVREKQKSLRDKIYGAMESRSKTAGYTELVHYVKRGDGV